MTTVIETDLKEFLAEKFDEVNKNINKLETKIDNVHQEVSELKIGQARLEKRLTEVEKDVTEINGFQQAQIWTLIGILGTAVVCTAIGFLITANPSNP